jgi:hypothetical protein
MIEMTAGLGKAVFPGGADGVLLAAQPLDGKVRYKSGSENHT